MKFMKLGTRPDTFFTKEAVRSVSSEVSTDLQIQVQDCLYQLHKFPLLSKCLLLQKLYSRDTSEHSVIQLPDIPGGAEAFDVCAKFCYGITITLSPLNIVPVRCAAEYLEMTDHVDRGNLAGKLEVFFTSCILRRWKDTLVTLQSTRQVAAASEELGITGRCIDAIATSIIADPRKTNVAHSSSQTTMAKIWWAEDIAELGVDHYWRIMIAVKSAGVVPNKLVGEALKVYSRRWLPDSLKEVTGKTKPFLEKIVSLLPAEKGSVSCSFLLKLLKAANVLNASASLKMDLAKRVALQLEEATVYDLLIPSSSTQTGDTLYDIDMVKIVLEEFFLQGQSPPTSPPREKLLCERRRRSRSAENVDFEVQESSRRSSSASHSSKLRVAKLMDGYLQEIAQDVNLPMENLIALAEAVPDFARTDHDDLYGAIDIYLKAHPSLGKNARKQLCRILDCKKLSVEACMHAAQNELLPLRVVVQVLFFEQSRSAMSGELPSSIRALLAKTTESNHGAKKAMKLRDNVTAVAMEDSWSITSGLEGSTKRLSTLKMKLEEDENDMDDDVVLPEVLMRSSSSRFKALCSLPTKPKKMFSKFLSRNRSLSERD